VSDWASALSWGRDESELVSELQAGSEAAFDVLVTHYHAPVFNLILRMRADPSDAADGTQEVFLKAFKGIRSFRQGSSLKTWLYRIAIREALNHRRWFKRHLQKNVSIDAEPQEGQARLEIEDMHATPFDQLASREIQSVVQSALNEIPDVFRSAVILRDLEGLSYEEVAEVLECSVGTVKSRILRGRRALKDLLDPLLREHAPHAAHSAPSSCNLNGFSAGTLAPAASKERGVSGFVLTNPELKKISGLAPDSFFAGTDSLNVDRVSGFRGLSYKPLDRQVGFTSPEAKKDLP
jgi:RNA polymerase sigma-70 factor (ECF subfamily)